MNKEKCILCNGAYLLEPICEDMEHENSELKWSPLCDRCLTCLKDAMVMKEIGEAMERYRFRMNMEDEKVVYFCEICQEIINKKQVSIYCTKCHGWIHRSCTKFTLCKEARKHQYNFKCRNCENEDEAPKIVIKNKDLNGKNVEDR